MTLVESRTHFADNIHTDLPVSEIMSRELIMIRDNASSWEAARLMTQHKIGSVIVINEEGLVFGILTERDLLTRAVVQYHDLKTLPVGRIASRPIVSVTRNTSTFKALKLMRDMRIRRLVVVENSTPVGILTVSDVLRIVPELVGILQELMQVHRNNDTIWREEEGTIPLGGYCEVCGEWSEFCTAYAGLILCSTCIEERL